MKETVLVNRGKNVYFHSPTHNRNFTPEKITSTQFVKHRKSLPIFSYRTQLLQTIENHSSVVVVGETGSGKTTQIPQYILESSKWLPAHQKIAITQPRRIAAISVAKRVAQEIGCRLGDLVGYRVRFEDKTCAHTRLKFMTDGMLLRESLSDILLQKYAIIILDEAHERTVQTDVLIALARRAQQLRASTKFPLRIIAMSATIEAEPFAVFLRCGISLCPIIKIHGRSFPVSIWHLDQPESDFIDSALLAILQVHVDHEIAAGDILVFVTGQDDIESLESLLKQRLNAASDGKDDIITNGKGHSRNLTVLPLYASLPPQAQLRVFERALPGHRKVIVSTNIAETSLTINNIGFVIDCGLVKRRAFHARTGVEALIPCPISVCEAMQRAGRAGRQRGGQCIRLYTQQAFDGLRAEALPEILRCNLASVVLQLKCAGVNDIVGSSHNNQGDDDDDDDDDGAFKFLDSPPRESLLLALMHLYELEALDSSGTLTSLGSRMAKLPLDPPFAKSLLLSQSFGCVDDIITIVALLSSDNIFFYPRLKRQEADQARRLFADPSGDHLTLLNVFKSGRDVNFSTQWCNTHFVSARALRKAQSIREQLAETCAQLGMTVSRTHDEIKMAATKPTDVDAVRRCLVSALSLLSATLQSDGSYKAHHNSQIVYIHPTSSLFGRVNGSSATSATNTRPQCVIFTELVRTTKDYMRIVTEIDPRWLPELAPKLFATKTMHCIGGTFHVNQFKTQKLSSIYH